ncbi:MAG: dTDP-4-dehydrorhamnose 3,5-epimerase [Bdellovibrionales bacterium]|nr:dTDP-4-dehydrorhamnose 3,5-epimerase [Bdellovibrionales bacterium]
MKTEKTGLDGLLLIEMPVYRDARGFFMERFRADRLAEFGVKDTFVQDNHSRSEPGVLRGLHFQNDPPQGKLVGVVRGRVWDVAVDIRRGSPTFGKWYGAELSDENGRLLWIPHGFAHGFCVLGDSPADLVYKVTGAYNPKSEGGIRWNDPEVGIQWPVRDPSLSPRDEKLPLLSEL